VYGNKAGCNSVLTRRRNVCCSVLQCVAVCCSMLTRRRQRVLQYAAVRCSTLQHADEATQLTLQGIAGCREML